MSSVPQTIVVALGGNALSPPGERSSIEDQFRHTRTSVEAIVALAGHGWKIAVVHGNGPQVGDELVRNEIAHERVEPLPLGVLVASTAGWIGYMIQQCLQNALRQAGVEREVLTIITQTEVRLDDPALADPTKPIGHELPTTSYERLRAIGVPVAVDSAGRRRRLAASPVPVDVVEAAAVKRLLAEGCIVIASGGGGPPVYLHHSRGWEGIEAVVDKDRVAAVLGKRLKADTLLILTNVDAVYRDWGSDAAAPISRLSVTEARELVVGGGLGVGSMSPKLEAAADFVESGGRRAIIAHLDAGLDALRLGTGTHIIGEIE